MREAAAQVQSRDAGPARLEQRRPDKHDDHDEPDAPAEAGMAWGTDEPGPPPAVALAADLAAAPATTEPDPSTTDVADGPASTPGDEVANLVGVRFVPGGRVQWFDSGEADYSVGDRIVVDAERGTRLGWIASRPTRRPTRGLGDGRALRRVMRRATADDLRADVDSEAEATRLLRIAKDRAAALRLPLKVFRLEVVGTGRSGKVNLYYTSDEQRLDMRKLVGELTLDFGGARLELRQLGVRDEAKAVGGIGTCGLTLCCTTWLPDFVPVSIKMAKDQGLVLSPSKVSGQCGRLKCCLVYEQAGYAELRKGLPKLGKRVVGARGEGRVVEVDVLRQRLRVSYGPGDSEVVPAAEVKPLFPPGGGPRPGGPGAPGGAAAPDEADDDHDHDSDDEVASES